MMKNFRWVLIGLLLLLSNAAHAEGGCPLGLIPASGTNINSCVPMPPGYYNNQQQAPPQLPPPQWLDHWGAIATYEPNGSLGTATGMPSRSGAEQAALTDCQSKHGSTCKIQLSYRNQCAALVVSDKGYNVTPGATKDAAIGKGMGICTNSGDPNCHVYYSDCSLPVRIQ